MVEMAVSVFEEKSLSQRRSERRCGGKGGDVILQTDAQLTTLLDLTYPKPFCAKKGSHVKERPDGRMEKILHSPSSRDPCSR